MPPKKRISFAHPEFFRLDFQPRIFDTCLKFLMNTFYQMLLDETEKFSFHGPVDFYFDETTEKNLVIAGWDEYLTHVPPERRALYGNTPRFEDDRLFLPLQAADFRAWWVRKWYKELGFDGIREANYPFPVEPKDLMHIIMTVPEDTLVDAYMDGLRTDFGADIPLVDSGPDVDPDGPFPIERLFRYLKRILSGIFTR